MFIYVIILSGVIYLNYEIRGMFWVIWYVIFIILYFELYGIKFILFRIMEKFEVIYCIMNILLIIEV